MEDRLHLAIQVPPDWSRVEPVRAAVARCIMATLRDRDLEVSLGMVVAELLENAIKYGRAGAPEVGVVVRVKGERVHVTVENEVDEKSAHVVALQKRIEWMQTFSRPSDAYLAALKQIYGSGVRTEDGGLGIVRIAHEGGCQIDCDTTQPGRIRIRAACATR
jgi:hypothetical protein